jgi:hypothetical protein
MTQVADCLPKPSAHIPAAPAVYQDRLSGVKQVAAGQNFTVALRSNGEVWTGGQQPQAARRRYPHRPRQAGPQPSMAQGLA